MVDVPLFLSVLDVPVLRGIQEDFNEALWQAEGADADALLVVTNGQTAPTLTVEPGRWYRFRLCYGAVESIATFALADDLCEMQLLAKDGIYLDEAPRAVDEVPMCGAPASS